MFNEKTPHNSSKCYKCGEPKLLSARNEAELLLDLARQELKWQNDRAIMVGNRSTFWLGLILGGFVAFLRSDYFLDPASIDRIQIPILIAGALGIAVAAWNFWDVIGIKIVETFDASVLKKFTNEYIKSQNENCPKCFAMNEFLLSDHESANSILESAVKEADDRAESYRRGLLHLRWSSPLIVLALLLDVVSRF